WTYPSFFTRRNVQLATPPDAMVTVRLNAPAASVSVSPTTVPYEGDGAQLRASTDAPATGPPPISRTLPVITSDAALVVAPPDGAVGAEAVPRHAMVQERINPAMRTRIVSPLTQLSIIWPHRIETRN